MHSLGFRDVVVVRAEVKELYVACGLRFRAHGLWWD